MPQVTRPLMTACIVLLIHNLVTSFFFCLSWLKSCSFSFSEPVYTFQSAKGPLDQLSADYGYYYQCLTDSINFKLNGNNSNVNVTLTQIDFQPFDVRDGKFGNGKDWALNFNLYYNNVWILHALWLAKQLSVLYQSNWSFHHFMSC